MSGDSSLGIGIGLALKSYGRGLTYVKTDRALDLGNLAPFTIPDLSGNANTATLYSGIYVSTNGTTDKAIGANATALGSGNYYLTGKVKPAGTTAKTTMNGSTASNLTGLTAGVWQDFQTATASAITPSSINLGWDGTAFNATVDNWSDVKLHDASDDSVVAHWKLYDSAAASLDGYPALDCVGGYHGAHVGCAGGASEASILQTAGEDFNKRMRFNGVNDNVYRSVANFRSGDSSGRIKVSFYFSSNGSTQSIFSTSDESSAGSYIWLSLNTSGNVVINVISGGTTETILSDDPVPVGWNTLEFSSSGSSWTLLANGASLPFTMANGTNSGRWFSGVNLRDNISVGLLVRNTSILPFEGIISNLEIYDASNDLVFHWLGNGNTNADWTDQIGSNNGTVNGSPSLYHVAESETTAGQDALGNAIENPRPNERVLNLTAGTGYAEIADSASLVLTNAATWEMWGNFYELFSSSESLLSKWSTAAIAQRSWIVNGNNGAELNRVRLGISANGVTVAWNGYLEVPDSVSSLIFTYNGTIVAGYVNGSSVTVTTTFGSIPASMNVGTAPLSIGTDNDSGTMLLRQIGDIRIYDRALTADEVLKNYQARKSAYGL
jgi:hypothetical protein